ncbi:MAG: DinB family protein [Bacteroidota bacterium]
MTTQQYLSWFEEVVAPTVPMFKLVPPDKLDWKITPRSFALGQLIDHIPKSLGFNGKVIAGEELPLKSMREILVSNRRQPSSTVDEAVHLFESVAAKFRQQVLALGDERFQTGEVETPQFGKRLIWRYSAFIIEHHIHHLMELHLSLKALDINVHTGTLYRG